MSIEIQGPVSPSEYDTRPDATASDREVPEYADGALRALVCNLLEVCDVSLDNIAFAPRKKPIDAF